MRPERQARIAQDFAHRRAFGVGAPRDVPPARAELPPDMGNAAATPDLKVTHADTCTGPRPETTVWCRPGTRDVLLTVTRCADCGAEHRRRPTP